MTINASSRCTGEGNRILRNCFVTIALSKQCLALVYGLPPPRDPLFKESLGSWEQAAAL